MYIILEKQENIRNKKQHLVSYYKIMDKIYELCQRFVLGYLNPIMSMAGASKKLWKKASQDFWIARPLFLNSFFNKGMTFAEGLNVEKDNYLRYSHLIFNFFIINYVDILLMLIFCEFFYHYLMEPL